MKHFVPEEDNLNLRLIEVKKDLVAISENFSEELTKFINSDPKSRFKAIAPHQKIEIVQENANEKFSHIIQKIEAIFPKKN